MQLFSFESMLPAGMDVSGGVDFPAFLGAIPTIGDGSPLSIILAIVIGLPLGIIALSFPTWIASKMMLQPVSATFGRAIVTNLLHVAVSVGMIFVNSSLQVLAGAGGLRATMVAVGVFVLSLAIHIAIPSKIYEIGTGRALGLNILSALLALVIFTVVLVGFGAVNGFTKTKESLLASLDQIRQAQKIGSVPSLPTFSFAPSEPVPEAVPPPPPDYAAEIDGLLNAALHPSGPAPSLADREAMVRSLQEKIKAQRNNLAPGDARAALVYQNQYNRYLLLLNAVLAERKVQAVRDAAPLRSPTRELATEPH